jgi:hypothetical protein
VPVRNAFSCAIFSHEKTDRLKTGSGQTHKETESKVASPQDCLTVVIDGAEEPHNNPFSVPLERKIKGSKVRKRAFGAIYI